MKSLWLFLFLALLCSPCSPVRGQSTDESARWARLEAGVHRLDLEVEEQREHGAASFLVFFLFGAFCALWAQNTGRNAWVWFFLGLFFNFLTVLFLLRKNAVGLRRPFHLEEHRVQ